MDYVLVNDDQALFQPTFGAAVVMVQPGKLKASGPATFKNQGLCVDGDESSVSVAGCVYMTPQYAIPGSGTLTISALTASHKAQKTQSNGTKVLLVGGSFTAKFSVASPAQQPNPSGPPLPDATPEYTGSGSFVTTNTKFKGS